MTGGAARDEYPPEWIAQAGEQGIDPALFTTTPGGALHYAVWSAIRDVRQYELAAALALSSDSVLPLADEAVGRVMAIREARERASGGPRRHSDEGWARIILDVWPRLTTAQRMDAAEIVATLAALGLAVPAPPAEARGFTEAQIRRATARVRRRSDGAPTLADVASELHTSQSTLQRAVDELEIRWPPAAPDD